MKRHLALLLVLVMLVPAVPLEATSTPFFNVKTSGVELCAQSMCGAAIFAGFLFGQVGRNPVAIGTFAVAVNHEEPLPDPGGTKNITGGVFEFQIGLRTIKGIVVNGTLTQNVGPGVNTFNVDALLEIEEGGSGTLRYQGLLSHTVFPPTVVGTVVTQ